MYSGKVKISDLENLLKNVFREIGKLNEMSVFGVL